MKKLSRILVAFGVLASAAFADRTFMGRPTVVYVPNSTQVQFRLDLTGFETQENNNQINSTTWITLTSSVVTNTSQYERMYSMLLTAASTGSFLWMNCTGTTLNINQLNINTP